MEKKREILDMTDLRQIIFDTIEGVKKGTIKIEDAKVINGLAQTMVNSCKVEVEFVREVGGIGTGFMLPHDDDGEITPHEEVPGNGKQKQLEDNK